ncbi:MAG TPA: Mth938-like domain-containing protein [Ramlibacter sp.]|nr:Mth938-like domain-containing protein [Ramlibacter sp.]
MKLQPDRFDVQAITGYGPGWVGVGTEKITRSVVIGSRGERIDWPAARFEELGPEHFQQLADLGAEVVIFGSGDRIRFPRGAWLKPLVARGVGLETMDTAAACRTYNILAQEGRHVAAALLLESPG